MVMMESWFGDELTRKYESSITFDNPLYWTEEHDVTFPSAAWKSLDLVDLADTFHVRILHRGTAAAQWHQVVIYRKALNDKFGNKPIVQVRLNVMVNDHVVYHNDYEDSAWADDVRLADRKSSANCIADNSSAEGYQVHILPMGKLLDDDKFQANPKFAVDVEIVIKTSSGQLTAKTWELHAKKLHGLSQMLKDPSAGFVEFVFPAKDEGEVDSAPKLYALNNILENAGFDHHGLDTIRGGKTILSEPPSPISSSPTSLYFPSHRIYFVDEDYERFHLILSYLYTDRICFSDSPDIKFDAETPTTSDAEGVYAISIRLKLESLARKAFHFLQATTNIQNITARVFGEFAAEHPEVERWYEEYFLARWDEVKGLKEHNDFMQPSGGNDCRVFQNFWRLLSSRK